MSIEFFLKHVPATTTAQQKGVFVSGGKARFFEKKNVKSARETLMALLRPHVLKAPLEKPLYIEILWRFPYRKSEPKRNTKEGKFIPHCSRPDVDNLEKLMIDTLGRMLFFKDDSQIYDKHTMKVWGPTEKAGIYVYMEESESC